MHSLFPSVTAIYDELAFNIQYMYDCVLMHGARAEIHPHLTHTHTHSVSGLFRSGSKKNLSLDPNEGIVVVCYLTHEVVVVWVP